MSQSDSEESPPNSPCELSMETNYQNSPPPLVADFTVEPMDETGETRLSRQPYDCTLNVTVCGALNSVFYL